MWSFGKEFFRCHVGCWVSLNGFSLSSNYYYWSREYGKGICLIINRLLPSFLSAFVLRVHQPGTAIRVVSPIHRYLCLRRRECSQTLHSTDVRLVSKTDLTYCRPPRICNISFVLSPPCPCQTKTAWPSISIISCYCSAFYSPPRLLH